jgi:SAM-dependent methyltransferase
MASSKKPANNEGTFIAPRTDGPKRIVRDCYDAIAESWNRDRLAGVDARERDWLQRFFALLPSGARVADLGCGGGAPILVELVERGYQVTGVDVSREQAQRARRRCPSANIIEADLAEVEFPPASLDGVIAYDSIWHIPRAEQLGVFEHIRRWLVSGGAVLLTLGANEESASELHTTLNGAPTYYDAWPEEVTLKLLSSTGFSILGHCVYSIDPAKRSNGHLFVLAIATEATVDSNEREH